jgi:hypothetical protein
MAHNETTSVLEHGRRGGMSTDKALVLERYRRHAQTEIQATRHDPRLTDEEKRERIMAIRQAYAGRARAVIEESVREQGMWLTTTDKELKGIAND